MPPPFCAQAISNISRTIFKTPHPKNSGAGLSLERANIPSITSTDPHRLLRGTGISGQIIHKTKKPYCEKSGQGFAWDRAESNRRHRELSFKEIPHYQKIIVALMETGRIMGAIDEVEIE